MHDSSQESKVDAPDAPPDYKDTASHSYSSGSVSYYPQLSDTCSIQQGSSQSPEYPSTKPTHPQQCDPQEEKGYPNHKDSPQEPPSFQQTPPHNDQIRVIVPQPPNLIEPFRNYLGLAIFSMFMFWPTGIIAILKASEAQTQYARGDFANAQTSNDAASKFIKISVGVNILILIIMVIVLMAIVVIHRHVY